MENTNNNPIKNLDEFIQKIDKMKKQDKMDLSSDQDLSIAIMNLVSIEEHFFFTAKKTNKPEYFDLLQEVRTMRGELLRKIVKDPEGEEWCISKHLLAASMRLMEVGTKQFGMGKKNEARDLFDKAYNLYSLFWGLNMKLINKENIKKIDGNALNIYDTEKKGFMGKLSGLVKKVVNCCIE
ncbi:hypothetical protein CVV26_02585 [Candidatus Kuenenbacteria bacterium HGW-Kuenenbacteria-1]|uniref:Uncharacterized protein n=1 Tax=Candidatus Kuenenbacteria bacterium HGW-Kuenenbacteria-1 TaxID=2013812 RepID=A0A2N1UN42_9BACT|nr:MAG: hypothetical protein CVV26_02585 [Candidatus Kuenenbacteria bacterium HGW-Kuenenbacteria-1]